MRPGGPLRTPKLIGEVLLEIAKTMLSKLRAYEEVIALRQTPPTASPGQPSTQSAANADTVAQHAQQNQQLTQKNQQHAQQNQQLTQQNQQLTQQNQQLTAENKQLHAAKQAQQNRPVQLAALNADEGGELEALHQQLANLTKRLELRQGELEASRQQVEAAKYESGC